MTNAFGEGPRDVDGGPAGLEGQAPECRAAPTLAPSTSNLIEAGQAFETLRSIGDETGIGAELQGRPAGRSRGWRRCGNVTVTAGRLQSLHRG